MRTHFVLFVQTLLGALVALVTLAACAPAVSVRSDVDPTVNLNQYSTYSFFTQLGIEGNSYDNLLGSHFREEIFEQMSARGFQQSANPQLQVNVSADTTDKIRVNTYQEPYLYGGYYGGFYDPFMGGPWYGGPTRTSVHQYTQASVYIDLVDAEQHKLVWQGVATFTLSDKMQKDVQAAVDKTVSEIFSQFPLTSR